MSTFIGELPLIHLQLVIFALSSVSVGTVLLAQPWKRRGADRLSQRIDAVSRGRAPGRSDDSSPEGQRRRQIESALRELEARHRAKAQRSLRPTLVGRMRQGGLNWSKRTYYIVCVIVGAGAYISMMALFDLGLLVSLGFGAAAGLVLPHLYVTAKRNKRLKAFEQIFPDALDVVVRGVKAGLPLVDTLKTIATEMQEPVKSEFTTLTRDLTVGVTLEEAIERLAQRVPLSEASFFSIVLVIQSRTGGNLSEALGNLSKVLRDRKNLRGKIKAMSAEAKASAGIIGSMPVVVAVLLYLTSPDYISLLLTTGAGKFVLAGSLTWMFVGSMIMRKMINFEI